MPPPDRGCMAPKAAVLAMEAVRTEPLAAPGAAGQTRGRRGYYRPSSVAGRRSRIQVEDRMVGRGNSEERGQKVVKPNLGKGQKQVHGGQKPTKSALPSRPQPPKAPPPSPPKQK